MAEKLGFVSCFVGHHSFGIEVAQVQEVTHGGRLTRVPLASSRVCGLLNLRGQIVAVIDLRQWLHLGERPEGDVPVHVILQTDEGCVSLLVDRVGDVLEVDERDFEWPPDTMRGRTRELIRGVYKLDGGLLLALDTEKILSEMEQTLDMGDLQCSST
jgi:purine-binding chemotaxis protein CheW